MDEYIVSASDLHKSYRDGASAVEVIRGVSFSLPARKLCALVGPSGSGKSTLLNLIAGLDTPEGGSLTSCGRELSRLSSDELADYRLREIGIVFQFFNFLPTLSLLENVELPAKLANTKSAPLRERALTLLQRVGLEDKLKRLPRELSGGELQRGAIARALINSPKLLLADEPTGNLDRANGAQIISLCQELVTELGVSIFVVTHDNEVINAAERVLRIEDGKLLS